MGTRMKSGWTISNTWMLVLVCSGLWWWFAGESDWHRTALLIGLSLASFGVGSAAGFLFTSFGEEQGTLGKIRDWLIGGITGITVAATQGFPGKIAINTVLEKYYIMKTAPKWEWFCENAKKFPDNPHLGI